MIIETTGGIIPAIIQANFVPANTDTRIFDVQSNARLILNNIIVENGNTFNDGGTIFNNGGTVELYCEWFQYLFELS